MQITFSATFKDDLILCVDGKDKQLVLSKALVMNCSPRKSLHLLNRWKISWWRFDRVMIATYYEFITWIHVQPTRNAILRKLFPYNNFTIKVITSWVIHSEFSEFIEKQKTAARLKRYILQIMLVHNFVMKLYVSGAGRWFAHTVWAMALIFVFCWKFTILRKILWSLP